MSSNFVDINLLSKPVRPAIAGEARHATLLALVMLGASLLLLVGASTLRSRNEQALAEQEARLQQLQEEVQEYSVVAAQVESLQQQVMTLATQAEQLEADAERIQQANPSLAPFLRALTEALLPRMEITSLAVLGESHYLVQGEAGSDALVAEYIEVLRQYPAVRSVTPRSVSRIGGEAVPGAVRWTVEVER